MKATRTVRTVLAGMAAWAVMACAAGTAARAAEEAAETPPTRGLRHAVVCPPFTGTEPYARMYHEAVAEMLRASDQVTFLEGSAAAARRTPKFTYRLTGAVTRSAGKRPEVTIQLVDGYRNEVMATHRTGASTNAASLEAWCRQVKKDLDRRVRHVPFECVVTRVEGRQALVLDRGLDAGLEPRMTLYVSGKEEVLLDPQTGEVVGRDAPQAYGQIVVYRVNSRNAYARPVPGTKLPKRGTWVARSF